MSATSSKKPILKIRKKSKKKTKKSRKEKIQALFKDLKYFYAIGRRKSASAQVRLYPEGKGRIYINYIDYRKYFSYFEFQKIVTKALSTTKEKQNIDISVKVKGGGVHSQADATSLGIARAIANWQSEYQEKLKALDLLTRDSRVKERKKPGLKRARRAPQWQKR